MAEAVKAVERAAGMAAEAMAEAATAEAMAVGMAAEAMAELKCEIDKCELPV